MQATAESAFSTFRAFGDEPRVSPLTDCLSEDRTVLIWVATRSYSSHCVTDALFLF